MIASKLKAHKIAYRRGNVGTNTDVAFSKGIKPKPFELDGKVEETYTPR